MWLKILKGIVVAAKATGLGFELATIVSPHAWVSPTAKLGPGTVVMAGAVIQVEASIGACGIVNTGASVDHECTLGRAVHAPPHERSSIGLPSFPCLPSPCACCLAR